MVLVIIAIVWLAGLAALVLRLAAVHRRRSGYERTGRPDTHHEHTHQSDTRHKRTGQPDTHHEHTHQSDTRHKRTGQPDTGQGRMGPEPAERSPNLLETGRASFEHAIGELLEATPAASSSKPAPAEHVGDGTQEDLYVGP